MFKSLTVKSFNSLIFSIMILSAICSNSWATKENIKHFKIHKTVTKKVIHKKIKPPANKKNLFFIVDGSGSMWEKIGNLSKISIAKKVLTSFIRDLPDGINVGLTSYGERYNNDCRDVNELVPLGPLNKKSVFKSIKSIVPKGKTPIALALKQTLEKFIAFKDEITIILISDGQETCGGNPCNVVNWLNDLNINFVTYVIGFNVSNEDKKQLQCIAKAGKGKYFLAKNAKELKYSLEKILIKKKPTLGYLEVTAYKYGKMIESKVNINISNTQNNITIGHTTTKGPTIIELQPKVYDVMVYELWDNKQESMISFYGVEIKPGETVKVEAIFSGRGMIELKLLPGLYNIRVEDVWGTAQTQVVELKDIEIKAGEKVEQIVEFENGFLEVFALKNGKPINSIVKVKKKDTDYRIASDQTSVDDPVKLKLLPGAYDVQVNDKWGSKAIKEFKGVVIKAGKTQTLEAIF